MELNKRIQITLLKLIMKLTHQKSALLSMYGRAGFFVMYLKDGALQNNSLPTAIATRMQLEEEYFKDFDEKELRRHIGDIEEAFATIHTLYKFKDELIENGETEKAESLQGELEQLVTKYFGDF